jgi:hypothetical protein
MGLRGVLQCLCQIVEGDFLGRGNCSAGRELGVFVED